MKNLFVIIFLFIYTPNLFADENKHQRYESKSPSEKRRFDQNLNRYNSYSQEKKKEAREAWRNFKKETTPEERKFIMEKMRNQR